MAAEVTPAKHDAGLSQVRTDNVVKGILLCAEHDALRLCNTKKMSRKVEVSGEQKECGVDWSFHGQ